MGDQNDKSGTHSQRMLNMLRKEIAFLQRSVKTLITAGEGGGGDSRPYKSYSVLLNQSGTAAPIATILENTLGFVPVWTYVSVGEYHITSPAGGFPSQKTSSMIQTSFGDPDYHYQSYFRNDISRAVLTFEGAVGVNGILEETHFEIKVYD